MSQKHVYVDPRTAWDEGWAPYEGAVRSSEVSEQVLPDSLDLPVPEIGPAYTPAGTNLQAIKAGGRDLQEHHKLNVYPDSTQHFSDAIGAGFNQSLLVTAIGDLYEQYEFNWKARMEGTYGKETPVNLTPEMTNGLTEDELDELEGSYNQTHALMKLERMKDARKDFEIMGQGGLFTRIGAPFLGSLGDAALGLPGGSVGARIGAQIGRNMLSKGSTVASAAGASRVVGAAAGNILSGAVPEAVGTLFDPYRGWEDVIAASLFDAAGTLGSIRGAIPNKTDRELIREIGTKILNTKTTLADWVRKNEIPDPAPTRPDLSAAAAHQTAATPPSSSFQEAEVTPTAGDSAAFVGLEDVSWASQRELDNLGVHTFTTEDGKVYYNKGDRSVFDLPKGTRDSLSGITSTGETSLPEVPDNPGALQDTQNSPGGTKTSAKTAKTVEEIYPQMQKYFQEMQAKGYDKVESTLRMYQDWFPDQRKVSWTREDNIMYPEGMDPQAVELAKGLLKEYGDPTTPMVLASRDMNALGVNYTLGSSAYIINLAPKAFKDDVFGTPKYTATLIHEFGHAFLPATLGRLKGSTKKGLKDAVSRVRHLMNDPKRFNKAAEVRFGLATDNAVMVGNNRKSPDQTLLGWLAASDDPQKIREAAAYWASFDEITAQQFAKHVRRRYARGWYEGKKPKAFLVSKALATWVHKTVGKFWDVVSRTLKEDTDIAEIAKAMDTVFMEMAGIYRKGGVTGEGALAGLKSVIDTTEPEYAANMATHLANSNPQAPKPKDPKVDPETGEPVEQYKSSYKVSPQGQAYGLGNVNNTNPNETAGLVMMDRWVQRAAEEAPPPVQASRTSKVIGSKALKESFVGNQFLSASQIGLRSKNPVVRLVTHLLAESPSNLVEQRINDSGAIIRAREERRIIGDSLRQVRQAKKQWYKEQGLGQWRALFDTDLTDQWNKTLRYWLHEATKENAVPEGAPPSVQRAIKEMAEFHERANKVEQKFGVVGTRAEDLPNPMGYMQRILDPTKIASLSVEQKGKVIAAIKAQLRDNAGFSGEVADKVAKRYLDRAERARGGVFTPQEMALDSPDALRTLQDILRNEGYKEDEITAMTGPLLKGKDKHFHRKLQLDENLDLGDGITLGDLMWDDHESLLRDRARSTAGWAALAAHGIHGYEGMLAIRAAAAKGSGPIAATKQELDALEQILSEVSSVPMEGMYYSGVLDGAVAATSTLRLGGMGWTQIPEILNVANQIGALNATKSLADIPKLVKELKEAVKTGKTPDNPFLRDMERHIGHTFGTDGYFLASPWDTNGRNRDIRGSEETSKFIRGINAVGYVQGVLSGFRVINASQQRLSAQVTVEQALNRILNMDAPDTWLKDIGIDGELFATLKTELPNVADIENGKVVFFHARKLPPQVLDQLSTTVYRSVNQMIQGTFAGERGKYIHDSFWRAATQFRGYPLTSLEKQIARQVGNHGYGRVALMIAANMAMALPIVVLRTYVSSIGRHNQEEFLEKNLKMSELVQKTANYIPLAGMAGDIVDILQDLSGNNVHGTKFVGDRFLPAAGVLNDAYGATQNPYKAMNLLPGATLPFVIPAMNWFKSEVRDFGSDGRN